MAIGGADFTAKMQRGMGWKFGTETNTWDVLEPHVLAYLQELALEWNKQRSLSTSEFNEGLMAIVNKLKEDPENLGDVKTLLGL